VSLPSPRRRGAFTLVELLVVIAIIGVLIGLLMPAIQSSREAARKKVCGNNLKQIALGLHMHIASLKTLPPGYISEVDADLDDKGPGWAWGVKILPFIEQEALYKQVDPKKHVHSAAMMQLRLKSVPIFNCPSDAEREEIIEVPGEITGVNMATANYVGSAGTVRPTCKICRDNFDGAFGRNRPIKPSEMEDGLSNTLAVGERSWHWAAAAMWGVVPKSKLLDHQQPGRYAAGPAYVLGTTFAEGFNIEEGVMDDHNVMGTYAESFLSVHPGGCHFAFCDGGVRFVYDNVDPRVMNALATRASIAKGGQLVDPIVHDSPF
jgi:prepilin-type N-terminal cleavage/methylation domain-containing protein/prepilin-type processing-associated H-X9-DG protein